MSSSSPLSLPIYIYVFDWFCWFDRNNTVEITEDGTSLVLIPWGVHGLRLNLFSSFASPKYDSFSSLLYNRINISWDNSSWDIGVV